MIERKEIWKLLEDYDYSNIKVAAIASHSALDTFDGAKEEGFPTLAICQKGRHRTYDIYFKSRELGGRKIGYIDETWIFDKFNEVLKQENQEKLRKENVIFVPNRSFTSYCSLDEIENNFYVPMFGSRCLLRMEERGEKRDYYWLLEKEGLSFPDKIEDAREINELCIVKLHHAVKKLERGFFTCSSYKEYKEKAEKLLRQGIITKEDLEKARIERYIIGPVFNLDFFYSPLLNQIELLGIDWRFETSLDGHVRLPAEQQLSLPEKQRIPEYTVCGHNMATLRESLLEKAFNLAEKFVEACKKHYDYGIIGPFCLQTCVDKDLNFYIYDVAPRIGGGTNVHMWLGHPYGNSLWRCNMSTGRRMALELKMAIEKNELEKIVS
ncbi:MAG: 5-formaminoimidazole-4-carboxamide-1-(beta)-D-ribofuranosyl 5'-monophosphate synthetase [Thermoplasmata archaeon]|nr:MAG: 5-formaminoimidazole-4-carboxamide-1-(beta)-D-ribofuranosyl 5'-monophosphate synthetase [Thermoplasmata archaeon]